MMERKGTQSRNPGITSLTQRSSTVLRLVVVSAAIFGGAAFWLMTAQNDQNSTPPQPSPLNVVDSSFKAEVIRNILDQRVGTHTVAELNLPHEFVERLAERILRSS